MPSFLEGYHFRSRCVRLQEYDPVRQAVIYLQRNNKPLNVYAMHAGTVSWYEDPTNGLCVAATWLASPSGPVGRTVYSGLSTVNHHIPTLQSNGTQPAELRICSGDYLGRTRTQAGQSELCVQIQYLWDPGGTWESVDPYGIADTTRKEVLVYPQPGQTLGHLSCHRWIRDDPPLATPRRMS
jgi:hypothetical protein